MVSHMEGENAFLDFRERAPQQAHRDIYLNEGGDFSQRDSLVGGRASGIPGTVRGLHAAHIRYGSLPWSTLQRIAADPEEFYTGLTARQIVSQMVVCGGLITLQDLANYEAIWRTPLQYSWGDLGNVEAIKIDGGEVSAAADMRGKGEARLIR